MTSYVIPMPKFIQETIETQRKLHIRHSTITTQAGLHDTSDWLLYHPSTPVRRYYRYCKLQAYIKAYLISSLTSIMAAVFESLPDKRLALLKSSSYHHWPTLWSPTSLWCPQFAYKKFGCYGNDQYYNEYCYLIWSDLVAYIQGTVKLVLFTPLVHGTGCTHRV